MMEYGSPADFTKYLQVHFTRKNIMTVKDLIAALKKMNPNLEVYACYDHDQTPEKICSPSEIYVESADHTLWDGYAADAEEEGYTVKAVLL